MALYGNSSGHTLLYRQTLESCHFKKPAEKQGDKWMYLGLSGEEMGLVMAVNPYPTNVENRVSS